MILLPLSHCWVRSAALAPPGWLQSGIWPLLGQDITALTLAGDLRDLRQHSAHAPIVRDYLE
jgi:hypothetical protein